MIITVGMAGPTPAIMAMAVMVAMTRLTAMATAMAAMAIPITIITGRRLRPSGSVSGSAITISAATPMAAVIIAVAPVAAASQGAVGAVVLRAAAPPEACLPAD